MSRRVRYQFACSLDGFIAGPNGEYDWIPEDPDIDFADMFDAYDAFIMGRGTWEISDAKMFGDNSVTVVSTTMKQEDHPGITIISDNIKEYVEEMRARPGKDIWLFGGGKLFRTLYELDCVDTIEPAVIPIILGKGIPMVPLTDVRRKLELTSHRLYPKSGIMLLEYTILR